MASFVDSSAGAREHCEAMLALHPDLATAYNKISSLYTSKLWHQLTLAVLEFVSTPSSTLRSTSEGGNSYLTLYDQIILPVDKKLNSLSLARIASDVASSLLIIPAVPGVQGGDGVAARTVLENLLEKKGQIGQAATLFTESKLALLKLTQMQNSGQQPSQDEEASKQLTQIKEMIKTGSKMLETELEGAETIVHSAFYEASMTYRKHNGPPEAFYKQAMLYLTYTPLDQISVEEKYNLATGICLAALTGDGVFNFGEVVEHPILSSLLNTENKWLLDLMHVFSNGNVKEFQLITTQFDPQIRAQPALLSRADLVQEKITLLALVNMVFERPSSERTLEFSDISTRIGVPHEQVEWVIMRALSLGLICGSMDQVDETVSVTWVMPRVLSVEQLKDLSERFGQWAVKVSKSKDYMGSQIPTLA